MRFATALVADVTTLNFNLMFEIGFGIGLGQLVLPIRDTSYIRDQRMFEELGLDTIGYIDFANDLDLAPGVFDALKKKALPPVKHGIIVHTPLYAMKSPIETRGQMQLMATIKKSSLRLRVYDALELPRLSLHDCCVEARTIPGVLIGFVDPNRKEASVHKKQCA